jgi:hypothetical protein
VKDSTGPTDPDAFESSLFEQLPNCGYADIEHLCRVINRVEKPFGLVG